MRISNAIKVKKAEVVRCMDDLGRIVVPREMRRVYQLNCGEPVEIVAVRDGVLLRRHDTKSALENALSDLAAVLQEENLSIEVRDTLLERVQGMREYLTSLNKPKEQ